MAATAGRPAGDSGYLDLVMAANDAGHHLQALASIAGRIGAPSPIDFGLSSEADWQALMVTARVVMAWGTTVAELLAEGRPVQAPAAEGAQ